jgi:hypothetical protein
MKPGAGLINISDRGIQFMQRAPRLPGISLIITVRRGLVAGGRVSGWAGGWARACVCDLPMPFINKALNSERMLKRNRCRAGALMKIMHLEESPEFALSLSHRVNDKRRQNSLLCVQIPPLQ